MAETVKQLDMEKMEDLAYDNFVRARLHEAQMSAPFFHTNNRMELLKSLNTLQESTQIICFFTIVKVTVLSAKRVFMFNGFQSQLVYIMGFSPKVLIFNGFQSQFVYI